MRTILCRAFLVIAVLLMSGCSSSVSSKPAVKSATQADKIPDAQTFIMKSGEVNVLKLTTPADTKCIAADGSLHFTAPQYEVEFWLVKGAQTVDAATERISSQIQDEFKDFRPEHETDLTITNSPAKQLIGTGHEADDGDPGDADVIVFKIGKNIFIACNHGESLTPIGQQGLLTLVQTAQLP